METEKIIADLKQKILELEVEGNSLRERLDNYMSKDKKYYENNKDACRERVKEYHKKNNYYSKISADKKKEYAKTAYLNKKMKLAKEKNNENI
jgi:hypothetical protein